MSSKPERSLEAGTGSKAYRSVTLSGIAVACSLAGDMAMYTVLPIMYEQFGLTPIAVGILLAANRVVRLITNPVSDRLIRRFSARSLLITALFAGAVIAALYSTLPPFIVLLFLRMSWGFCWSVLRQVGIMNASGHAGDGTAGRMTGLYDGIVRIGFLVGTLASGILVDAAGAGIMFLCMAGIMLTGVIPGMLSFGSGEMVATARAKPDTKAVVRKFSLADAIKGFAIGSVGSGIVMSSLGHALNSANGNAVNLMGMVLGVATLNGIILGTRYVIRIVGSPVAGIMVDRIGLGVAEIVAFAGCAAALVLAAAARGIVAITAGILLFSVFETFTYIAITAEASSSSRRYAVFVSSLDLGAAAGPLVAWILIDVTHAVDVGFLLGATLYALVFAVTLYSSIRTAERSVPK